MTWQERVAHDLAEKQREAGKKRYVNLQKIERRKDNFGRWARNARRVDPSDRDVVRVSIPSALANTILAEAQDANYPYSRLIVVLAALGLSVYHEYRTEILSARQERYIPKLVDKVIERAFKKHKPIPQGWRSGVEEQLSAASLDAKRKREHRDPTEIMLRQFRGV